MWHSSILILTIIGGCAALEWQEGSFLSNHNDKQAFEEKTDHAISAWVASYNEAVSKDRSFWASTWQQVENNLMHVQSSFEKKVGMIQRSSNDPVSDLSSDPDVALALKRLKMDLAQNKNLMETVSAKQRSDEDEQKEFQSKYSTLWHEYEAGMQKDQREYAAAKKRYASIEAELHSFSTHSSKQYQSFLQVTLSLMKRESTLIDSLQTVAAHQKGTDLENAYRSKKNLYRSRLAFIDFCRDSLRKVQKIVKDEEKVSFAQLAWE